MHIRRGAPGWHAPDEYRRAARAGREWRTVARQISYPRGWLSHHWIPSTLPSTSVDIDQRTFEVELGAGLYIHIQAGLDGNASLRLQLDTVAAQL
jgi:hypothetical protein